MLLTKAKCHFLLGEDDISIPLFKKYCEISYSTEYESDVAIMEICKLVRKQTTPQIYAQLIEKLDRLISTKNEDECKIFKLRDMHQLKASILLLLGEYQASIR